MPVSINTQIKQGSTFFKELTLKTEDQFGVLDLTGAQIIPFIKSILGVVYYFDVEMVNAPLGKVKIKMPAYKTKAVNSGRYEFYVNVKLLDGTVVSSVLGIAEVEGVLPATVKQETRDVSFQKDIVVAYNGYIQGDLTVFGKLNSNYAILGADTNNNTVATTKFVQEVVTPVKTKSDANAALIATLQTTITTLTTRLNSAESAITALTARVAVLEAKP